MIFLAVTVIVFVLDRVSKIAAVMFLSDVSTLPVFSPVFHLTLVRNPGGAFGLFPGFHFLFSWVALAAIAVLISLYLNGKWRKKTGELPLALILGGALGNLYDRFFFGGVIDFLDFRVWPVFNVADSCITIGVVLLLWKINKSG